MTEDEYIRVTNKTKIASAIYIIRDCLPGKKYGLTRAEQINALAILEKVVDRLYRSLDNDIKTVEDKQI